VSAVWNPLEAATQEQLERLDRLYAMSRDEKLLSWAERIADDVGRLRRRFRSNDGWTGEYIADRIAGNILNLAGMLGPSAAELVAQTYPGDPETVEEALRLVDEHDRQLRARLGEKPS
jgi:hypothetical protein